MTITANTEKTGESTFRAVNLHKFEQNFKGFDENFDPKKYDELDYVEFQIRIVEA